MAPEPFLQAGGCQCGLLRYSVTAAPRAVYACHCTDCQSLSGSACGVAVGFAATAFDLSGTPRLIRRVLGSGTVSHRAVCPGCAVWICGGSKLDAIVPGEMVVVRGGTFDDTSWIRPTTHYWTRSAQPWIVFPEGVTVHPTQPS